MDACRRSDPARALISLAAGQICELGADSCGLARLQVVKECVRWFDRHSGKGLTVVGPAARSRPPSRLMEAVA